MGGFAIGGYPKVVTYSLISYNPQYNRANASPLGKSNTSATNIEF
jgi:hypothetical protein